MFSSIQNPRNMNHGAIHTGIRKECKESICGSQNSSIDGFESDISVGELIAACQINSDCASTPSPSKRKSSEPLTRHEESHEKSKSKWSTGEDKRLREAVAIYGTGNWAHIAKYVKTHGNRMCRQRWFYSAKPELHNLNRGKWTTEEDNKLRQIVPRYKCRTMSVWKLISEDMGYTRNHKQCRERWKNHLDPSLRHDPWTEEEDTRLKKLHDELGNKWRKISKMLPGRSSENVRLRFRHLIKISPTKRSKPNPRVNC